MKTIISLCDYTGIMVKPWVDAGYYAVLVDPQHEAHSVDGLVERVPLTILEAMPRLSEIIKTHDVCFVAGFPPCTDVAVSGSRWFAAKAEQDKLFQAKAALVAEQCRAVGMLADCPWFFENPVSVFSSVFGKPNFSFNPCDYTGYCADDNYTKKPVFGQVEALSCRKRFVMNHSANQMTAYTKRRQVLTGLIFAAQRLAVLLKRSLRNTAHNAPFSYHSSDQSKSCCVIFRLTYS